MQKVLRQREREVGHLGALQERAAFEAAPSQSANGVDVFEGAHFIKGLTHVSESILAAVYLAGHLLARPPGVGRAKPGRSPGYSVLV
jgi:hypothetical protein